MAIDPGIGFGKTVEQNVELIARLAQLVHAFADFPIVIGTSRKSFIGRLTNQAVPEERLSGSVATAVASVMNGANIVRVHDVRATREALCLADEFRAGHP
jgi:dihydropteroate synthase